MKKAALILGVLLISFGVNAQVESNVKQNDLKGPAFKNYKVWMDKSEPVQVYSQIAIKPLEGPAYKNQQFSTSTPKENLVLVNTVSPGRKNLTGPAYKNYGPWSKDF
jgi:hypothetical protein